jgi:hypothetical protein
MRKVFLAALTAALLLAMGVPAMASPAAPRAAPAAPRAVALPSGTTAVEAPIDGGCRRFSGPYVVCVLHAKPCRGKPIFKVSRVVAIWHCNGPRADGVQTSATRTSAADQGALVTAPQGPDQSGFCIPVGNSNAKFRYYVCVLHGDLGKRCRPGLKVFRIVSTWGCKRPDSSGLLTPVSPGGALSRPAA